MLSPALPGWNFINQTVDPYIYICMHFSCINVISELLFNIAHDSKITMFCLRKKWGIIVGCTLTEYLFKHLIIIIIIIINCSYKAQYRLQRPQGAQVNTNMNTKTKTTNYTWERLDGRSGFLSSF